MFSYQVQSPQFVPGLPVYTARSLNLYQDCHMFSYQVEGPQFVPGLPVYTARA